MKTTLYGSTDKSNSNRAEYRQIFRDDAKYAGVSFRKSKKKFLIGNQLHWSYFFVTKIP